MVPTKVQCLLLMMAASMAVGELRGTAKIIRSKRALPSSCTPRYEALYSSTMCQYHDSPEAKNRGVNKVMQHVIVAEHNKYRRKVQPTATNMQKMYWDDEIAAIAQKWANTCPEGHDTNDNREVPGYGISIGQNWASGFPTWPAAVKAWYDEVTMYRYGQDPNTYLARGFKDIGHYTQVVRDLAARVGCGFAECPGFGKLYVCNYAFGNPRDWGKPYESGPTCAACPKSCKNNLCDCSGVICLNGGELNPNKCSCDCPDLWSGKQCEKLTCPPRDPDVCGAAWGYAPRRCTEWRNVPQECPYMCGLCGDGINSENSVLQDENGGGEVPYLQTWNGGGKAAGLEECSSVDPAHCGKPQPFGFLPKHCRQWMNVPEECPAMCGRCKARCGGKSHADCQNGGSLNAETCACDCSDPYSGEHCETLASCPPVDAGVCGNAAFGYSPKGCEVIPMVRENCPIMCGLCEESCPGKTDQTCKNRGTLQSDCACACTPEFTGETCEKFVTCPRAQDKNWCGQFSAADCEKYFNFPTDCPHMCSSC